MIGYSDSNKDVGYLASGVGGVHGPGARSPRCWPRHGVELVLLPRPRRRRRPRRRPDQRRDPGAAARAPCEGRLKMTEQGEVLTAKYAVPARSPTASSSWPTSATLATRALAPPAPRASQRVRAARSRRWPTTRPPSTGRSSTTIRTSSTSSRRSRRCSEISRLRLGSPARQAHRGAAGSTICARSRGCSPGRSRGSCCRRGSDSARRCAHARERHGLETAAADGRRVAVLHQRLLQRRDGLRQGRSRDRAALRASCGTTRRRATGSGRRSRRASSARSRSWCSIGGGERLLDGEPVLQASIDRRNPFVDPLSFVQIELLRRLRAVRRDQGRGPTRRPSSSAG